MIICDRKKYLRSLAIGSAIISAGTFIAIYGGSVAPASQIDAVTTIMTLKQEEE